LKTIIIGLGNSSFADDGIGLLVARELRSKISNGEIAIVESSSGGLDILDIVGDFDRAIIVDAVKTENGKPGSIYRFTLDQISIIEESTPHRTDFLTAIALGKKLGLPLPESITIFGIEPQIIDRPEEGCSPSVTNAISLCSEKILAELHQ